MSTNTNYRWPLTLALVVIASCGSDPVPSGPSDASVASDASLQPGFSCSADTECSSGACLNFDIVSDAGCAADGKLCSLHCESTDDCLTLGNDYVCFTGCGTAKFCARAVKH